MSMNTNDRRYLKPLTHWLIYRSFRARFTRRTPERVSGMLTTAEGSELPFTYLPQSCSVLLPGEQIEINEYGWEIAHTQIGAEAP